VEILIKLQTTIYFLTLVIWYYW